MASAAEIHQFVSVFRVQGGKGKCFIFIGRSDDDRSFHVGSRVFQGNCDLSVGKDSLAAEQASFSGTGKTDADHDIVCCFAMDFHDLAVSFAVIAFQCPVAGEICGIFRRRFPQDVLFVFFVVGMAMNIRYFHSLGPGLKTKFAGWKNSGDSATIVHFPLAGFCHGGTVCFLIMCRFDHCSVRMECDGCADTVSVVTGMGSCMDFFRRRSWCG